MQFGFMPDRGITDALSVVSKMHEVHRDKKRKLYVCFVDIEKVFDKSLSDDEERIATSNCKSGDDPLSWGKMQDG